MRTALYLAFDRPFNLSWRIHFKQKLLSPKMVVTTVIICLLYNKCYIIKLYIVYWRPTQKFKGFVILSWEQERSRISVEEEQVGSRKTVGEE